MVQTTLQFPEGFAMPLLSEDRSVSETGERSDMDWILVENASSECQVTGTPSW